MRALRSADPARTLAAQPDPRAERDLESVLAVAPASSPASDPASASAPPKTPAGTQSEVAARRRSPPLVPALVLVLVAGLSAAVLGVSHPGTNSTAALPSSVTTVAPPASTGCHPVDVLPFQCGTYRSTAGAKSITGDTGGPAADPLTIWFSRAAHGLVLNAATPNCFDVTIPVRVQGNRLVRAGAAVYSEDSCHGHGADKRSWAYSWLNGSLRYENGGDGLFFGGRGLWVSFTYEGVTPYGQKPLPRNDPHCIAAHIAPFSCAGYIAERGTGSLAFLDDHRYRLGFIHLNAQLTAGLEGDCNALDPILEVDGDTVTAFEGAMTLEACTGPSGTHDNTIGEFFQGTLRYRITGDLVTFTGPTASATFRRR